MMLIKRGIQAPSWWTRTLSRERILRADAGAMCTDAVHVLSDTVHVLFVDQLWTPVRTSVVVSDSQEGNTQPQFWAEADKTWSWLDKEYQPFLAKIKADPQLLLADASESTYAYYASASGWHLGWCAAHVR